MTDALIAAGMLLLIVAALALVSFAVLLRANPVPFVLLLVLLVPAALFSRRARRELTMQWFGGRAWAALHSGNFREGERLHNKALTMAEVDFGSGSIVAAYQNNLAGALALQRRYEEAAAVYRAATDNVPSEDRDHVAAMAAELLEVAGHEDEEEWLQSRIAAIQGVGRESLPLVRQVAWLWQKRFGG